MGLSAISYWLLAIGTTPYSPHQPIAHGPQPTGDRHDSYRRNVGALPAAARRAGAGGAGHPAYPPAGSGSQFGLETPPALLLPGPAGPAHRHHSQSGRAAPGA